MRRFLPLLTGMRPGTALALMLALALAMAWPSAHAAESFPLNDAVTNIANITGGMSDQINRALTSPAVTQVINVLFTAMALGLFVWKFAGFAMRGFDMMDILEVMLTIMFVYILLTGYRVIFPAIFGGGVYVSNAIAFGIMDAPPSGSFGQALMERFSAMTFAPKCSGLDCIGAGIMALVATVIGWLAVIVLGIVAMLTEMWIVWGFAIAYAIGWVTIPFLLYERLSFLFEGWLKFFFGMIVYAIVAKTNLALVFLSAQLFLGSSSGVAGRAEGPAGSTVVVSGFFDIIGLLVFLVVGIFALLASGRFASAIVMAAGGGGVGGLIQGAAGAAANAASAGAGMIAGATKR